MKKLLAILMIAAISGGVQMSYAQRNDAENDQLEKIRLHEIKRVEQKLKKVRRSIRTAKKQLDDISFISGLYGEGKSKKGRLERERNRFKKELKRLKIQRLQLSSPARG